MRVTPSAILQNLNVKAVLAIMKKYLNKFPSVPIELIIALTCCLFMLVSYSSLAGVSQKEVQKLGEVLTPFGSILGGNIDRSIPAWTGGISKPEAKSGEHHTDLFKDEEPILVIDSDNLEKYSKNLTAGQLKMFNSFSDSYSMNIYPSYRTHAMPDWVNKNSIENAKSSSLSKKGTGVINAYGGIAFPILHGSNSDQALQTMWNHMTRWRGIYVVRRTSEIAVNRNGQFNTVINQQEVLFNFHVPGKAFDDLDNKLLYYITFTVSPARLAGGALLVHETLDQTIQKREAWDYNAGQRRVRRAPNLAYDSPLASSNHIAAIDEVDMYNGAPDRYSWNYKGLSERYIPYNNYKINEKGRQYSDMLKPGHIDPEFVRWEKHRVHVVEATLKKQSRHVYAKRTFYIDEDSWSIAMSEQYDRRGEMLHFNMSLLKNFYELPGVFTSADVIHDLQSQKYFVHGLYSEETNAPVFHSEPPPKRYFTSSSLRRRGR